MKHFPMPYPHHLFFFLLSISSLLAAPWRIESNTPLEESPDGAYLVAQDSKSIQIYERSSRKRVFIIRGESLVAELVTMGRVKK